MAALYRLLRMRGLEIEVFLSFDDLLISQMFFEETVTEESKNSVIEAIRWAVNTPGIDFSQQYLEFDFTNAEIYQYLNRLLGVIDVGEFSDGIE